MKKIFPIFLILPFLFSNCKKEDPVLFEMLYIENFTIPAGINPFDAHYFRIENIPVGTYLSSRNLTTDMLNSINPRAASFVNVFAGTASYDLIRDVIVRIYTDDENNYKELFYRKPVPEDTGDNLGIIPSLGDAKDFLSGTSFNIIIRLNFRRPPIQNIDTRFQFTLGAK